MTFARRAARALAALAFSSLVLLAPAATPDLGAQQRTPAAPAEHQRLAREVYEELVEINTADSVGSTTRAAEAMAARFRAAGFPEADVRVLVPPGKPTKGNLVVRYRGRGDGRPILLLAHLDVVAALRSDWSRDPFELQEANGYFYGRGVADDKAMAAIFVANMLRYRKEGWTPTRDLILALTADEEGGDANGVAWLLAEHRGLIDAAYTINEGGGGVLIDERPAFLSVQAAEKVPTNFTLTATNPGGHSSVPRPDNAIYALSEALARLSRHRFPVALNEVTRAYFTQTARTERPEMAAAMRAILANPGDSAAAATLSRNTAYAAMLRTTCVATRLAGGHAYNALPQTASANVNCRVVPGATGEQVRSELARIAGDTTIKVTPTIAADAERFDAAPSPLDPAVFGVVGALTREMWGDIPVVPTMSTGATDGRFLRAAGIPTYGVSGIFSAPGESNAHGRDEKLRVRSFYEGLHFLDQLVRRLAGAPAS